MGRALVLLSELACRVGVSLETGDGGTFFFEDCFLPADDLIMSRTFLGGNSLVFESLYEERGVVKAASGCGP